MLNDVDLEAFAVRLEACGVDVVLKILQERVVCPFNELACQSTFSRLGHGSTDLDGTLTPIW